VHGQGDADRPRGVPRLDAPAGAPDAAAAWGSDAVAAMIRRLGYRYVALNPGASFRGLHDSLVNHLGNADPGILLVLHEEHAVAIAHGYAKAAGEPMAVVLHSNVGLMHAVMAVYNAWCDRVPMLVLGATGAVDAARRRPWIEWIHTSRDQGALVRHYVKWDDQPASVPAALNGLLRADRTTRTAPTAPVYVCLDVSVQEDPLPPGTEIPDPARFRPSATPAPAPDAVAAAARVLAGARRPLILAGRVGRSADAWDLRVRLAERLGARVLTDLKCAAQFPTGHPLHVAAPAQYLSPAAAAALARADAVLSLDWSDVAGTLKTGRPAGAPAPAVVHCSLDEVLHNGWSLDHQELPAADVPILADPDALLAPLLAALPDRTASDWPELPADPRLSPSDDPDAPPTLAHVAAALERVRAARPVTLARLPLGWPEAMTPLRGPLDYLGYDGGGGIGSGLGMGIGAALALAGTGRLTVAAIGDGDFLMGANAVWTAVHHRIPLLVLVHDNRSFFNDEVHQERVALRRGRPVENRWIGQRIEEPAVDLVAMARAQGAEGEAVARAGDLDAALARAVAAVDRGGVFVLDVLTITERDRPAAAAARGSRGG
jgi:thiamine pyrophosphate-dependent acetolactate synthase large subunit-like protein